MREGSQVKNFTGNTDATGYVTNLFNRDIPARHIRIHPVTWHKTTDYPCMRATALGRRTGFLGSPVFTTRERSYITAYSNQRITLNCDAVGDTPMTFTWIYEGQVIQNKTDQPSLILTNVTKSNEGFYTCNASNSIGVYSKNLYLHVKESFEVCTRYQTIVDNSRWVGATSIASSDTTFNESDWYVFKDSHNNFYQIPTTCVPQKHCGALAPGYMQGSLPTVDRFHCMMYCRLEGRCKSFNHNQVLEICELNDATTAEFPDHLTEQPGYITYDSIH
ncbi:Neuroglian [Exaiptasia diaphana]|nr:Neuroglian [Exaiptasia diaphana]